MSESKQNPIGYRYRWWGQCVGLFIAGTVFVAGCDKMSEPPRSSEPRTIVAPSVEITSPTDELQDASTYFDIMDPPANGEDPVVVGPVTTFWWDIRDGMPRPAAIRWILVDGERWKGDWDGMLDWIRLESRAVKWTNWYQPWSYYQWTTPELRPGNYMFVVQGRDGNGVEETEFDFQWNARKIVVDPAVGGPVLTVYNEYIDPVISTSMRPPFNIDFAGNVPLQFCWTADASGYGGNVEAYRYGWDVFDSDPAAWETDWLPYDGSYVCAPPRVFSFDTHTFYVEVVDNRGMTSLVGIGVNFVLPERFFFIPGSCETPLNLDRKGPIRAVIPGAIGWDVHDIDVSTVRLDIGLENHILPSASEFRDVASPLILGFAGDCGACPPPGADGMDDLLLTFSATEITRALEVTASGEVWVPCYLRWGQYGWWGLGACVRIVGNPLRDDPVRGHEGRD